MIEIIKGKKYEEILNFSGKYEISKVDDFYNRFAVEKKYQILKNFEQRKDKKGKIQEDKINVEIKRADGYFVNETGEREYIFEISYFPLKFNISSYFFPFIISIIFSMLTFFLFKSSTFTSV